MGNRWQPLALAAAVGLMLGAGTATAQTVIVKGLPAGTPTELVLNGATVATAAAEAAELATLSVPSSLPPSGTPSAPSSVPSSATQSGASAAAELDVHIFVDRCGTVRRVLLVEGALAPPGAETACVRQTVPGFFVVRRTTSIVIDVSGSNPVLWLTQGRVPDAWLKPGTDIPERGPSWGPAPTGLMLFGGAGLTAISDLTTVACGDVTTCNSPTFKGALGAGVAYWFGQFIAAEAQYIDPANGKADGSDTNYSFNSTLETRMLTLAGLVGGPVGRTRLYGRAGVNRHRAILHTTQTVADTSVTLDDGTIQPIPGGSQTLELRTEGWGYLFGGGLEVWLSKRVAFYGDFDRASLKGKALNAPEGTIDNGMWLAQVGARIRIR